MTETPQDVVSADVVSAYPRVLRPRMNPAIKALWVTALLDGNSEQGRGFLGYTSEEDGKEKRCCLGVLCDLAVLAGVIPPAYDDPMHKGHMYGDEREANNSFLPTVVRDWAGLSSTNPVVYMDKEVWVGEFTLSGMNDEGQNFTEIAAAIAKSL